MEKFKIIAHKQKKDTRKQMMFYLDIDLQHWIRRLSTSNNVSNSEVMHQIIRFAKKQA